MPHIGLSSIGMPEAELLAVSQELQEISGTVSSHHEHDLPDPGIDQCPDRIVDHGPIIDRQEMFVGDPRERVESYPEPAGQYDSLHTNSARRQATRVMA